MIYRRILIIQTAFIGDVVLATPLIEKLRQFYPEAQLDFLLRKGNESLLDSHPYVNKVIIWDKKTGKIRNLLKIIAQVRRERYDLVVNLQRFFSTGLITGFSGAGKKTGFRKNPLSWLFDERLEHRIGGGTHEVARNLELITSVTDDGWVGPKLYLRDDLVRSVAHYKTQPYITIAPTSVWFTKQFPLHKWVEFLQRIRFAGNIYLLGGPSDREACEEIRVKAGNGNVTNLCGALSLIQSAALMKDARMNYMNDSAPQHFASAVNAPTTVIFCSTVPAFGFGPLADEREVVETEKLLGCRPCGLHGYRACPLGHFECAESIKVDKLLDRLSV